MVSFSFSAQAAAALLALTAGLTVVSCESPAANTSISLRFITHNIRYAASSLMSGEKPWQTRRPKLVGDLKANIQGSPDGFICMQEVLNNQLRDIHSDLNAGSSSPEWNYIGVGRDDGKEKGEYSPIFYRPASWTLDLYKTVWLSPTPDVPSKGWDAGSIRILTIGQFIHKATSRKVLAMCTHLDNAGSTSRLNSAKIITDRINLYTGVANNTKPYIPLILGGDFNSAPSQEAYKEMSKSTSIVTDLRLSIPENKRNGPSTTFSGFTDSTSDDSLIDFIWLGPKSENYWEVSNYTVLANKHDDGVYSSDHRAVIGDVRLVG